jgi:hypothetical protein
MAPYNYGTSPNSDDLQELDLIYGSRRLSRSS